MDLFSDVLAQTLAFGTWYEHYSWAIDGLVYLVLFVGIAKVTLGARYSGRGGTAVVAAVGTALAFGAATLAYRSGFTLARLGPLAWIILLAILGILVFDLARSVGLPTVPSAAVSVVLLVATAEAIGESLEHWLEARGLLGLLRAAAIVATVVFAIWLAERTGGGLRRTKGASELPRKHEARTIKESVVESTAAEEIERSLAGLLDQGIRHVRSKGVDKRSGRLLKEIERRERFVTRLYRRVLRHLAEKRWKESEDTQQLASSVRELLGRAKQNVSSFGRQLEIARAGQSQGNGSLLLQALERMLAAEQEGEAIARELVVLLKRLSRPGARRG